MIPRARILCLLLFVYMVEGTRMCTITRERPKEEGYCTAEIECNNYISINFLKSGEWDCIRQSRYSSYDYGYRRPIVQYDSRFNLIITVKNTNSVDEYFVEEKENIVDLTLESGSLLSIPDVIYQMERLENISISGNEISAVKLYSFLPMNGLKKINLANNSISVIEVDDVTSTNHDFNNNVKIIDISSNEIVVVPNNFLSKFSQLQQLNMSHNMIDTIGVLTFEGISNLKILDLSYNKLIDIGHTFARFVNLENLVISNNLLTKLTDINFVTLTNLVKFNVSSNNVAEIEEKTFQSLINLEDLDLSNNKIKMISKQLFSSNINLNSLSILSNRIQNIEANSFMNNKVQVFSMQNNELVGALIKDNFQGLNVNELNLYGGNVTSIQDYAFMGMPEIKILNLSSNAVNNISSLAFYSLTSLEILDLSQNQLEDLSFDSSDLKNLSKLFVHHNKIKKITGDVFKNFEFLTELDMSYNQVQELGPRCFFNLSSLEHLNLTGSNFVNELKRNAFEGLKSLRKIDLSKTKTTCFRNESFYELVALTLIHSDFGQLSNIEYNAFLGTGSIEKLTLSNNQLRNFHVNTSTISNVQEINLSNNFIRNVSSETFSRLSLLRNLNLANNDLIMVDPDAFMDLKKLTHLDLSSNTKLVIIGNLFKNITKLNRLTLNNVKTEITFENSSAAIETVQLQSCSINDINKVQIFNIQDLAYLYLSSNEISSIDKDSFRSMPSLVSLDLSMNKIVYIQPGSFIHLMDLETLNLFSNNLASIKFGVFDGFKVLNELNLSSNVLSRLEIKSLPHVIKLYLDDNIITDFDFKAVFKSEIRKLSIGGNQLPCKILAELKTSNDSTLFARKITAKTFDYHSENINGISCLSIPNDNFNTGSDFGNGTFDFSSLVTALRNYVDKFGKSVETIANQYTLKNEKFDDDTRNARELLESFINSSHYNHVTSNNFLTKLTDISNNSNIELEEIKNYIVNLTMALQELEPANEFNSNKLSEDQSILYSQFKKMLEQENNALREEFKIALASLSPKISPNESILLNDSPNKDSTESKGVFYFIAICLAILVVAFVSNIAYNFIKKFRRPRNSLNRNLSTTTNISNNIELG